MYNHTCCICRLHTVYKIIHCAALHTLCDITQRVSNYYTVKGQFFTFNLEKITLGRKFLHRHRLWCLWQISGMLWTCGKKQDLNVKFGLSDGYNLHSHSTASLSNRTKQDLNLNVKFGLSDGYYLHSHSTASLKMLQKIVVQWKGGEVKSFWAPENITRWFVLAVCLLSLFWL